MVFNSGEGFFSVTLRIQRIFSGAKKTGGLGSIRWSSEQGS